MLGAKRRLGGRLGARVVRQLPERSAAVSVLLTRSRAARKAAGLSPAQAAKVGRCSVGHLLNCERQQDFALVLAERLSRRYGTLEDFSTIRAAGTQPGVRAKRAAACGSRSPRRENG